MRADKISCFAALIASVPVWSLLTSGAASAQNGGQLDGTFTAYSSGQWAQTNQSYHNEASVTSTWTFESTCSGLSDCTGHVTSDLGWTGEASYVAGSWRVRHTIDNWQQCGDGTTAPGEQLFHFWRDPANPTQWIGWDKTTGPSGGCGINKSLVIQMPFTLTPRG
jgi:hypothetical protein